MFNKTSLVKNCKTCPFYDDGHGNGSYCRGMDCGPANCTHHSAKRFNVVKNDKVVPSWCPLRKNDYIETITTTIKLIL